MLSVGGAGVKDAQVIAGLPLEGPLGQAWRTLDEAGRCEPNTSREWVNALLASHVTGSDRLLTIAIRVDDETIAIMPALIRRQRVGGLLAVDTLMPLCDLTTCHSDILRASDTDDVGGPLLEACVALPWRWDVLRVARLLEASPVARQLAGKLTQSGIPHRIRREQPSYFLELGRSYEEYLARRSAKFRNYLRRKSRQLRTQGELRFRKAGHDCRLDDAYSDLLQIESNSWKHARGTAISAVPRQREFYRRLCEGAIGSGRLHLTLMYLDGRPVAYNLGLTALDRYSYLKTSFDERLRSASPATVMRAHLIETLIGEGIRVLDFPAEPYEWEDQWADQLRWHTSILAFNRTPEALLYRAIVNVRDAFRRADHGDQVRHVDPRR